MQTIVSGAVRPRSGDLVLARVERLGHHAKLESPAGRRATMHLGDEIIVCFADRYAPDQFESHVPMRLGPTQLVASGGVASQMLSRNRGVRNPTDIAPIGLVADAHGEPLNLRAFGLEPVPPPTSRPPTIAVVGTSMNAGKTTTAHRIVHSLVEGGHRPGATKVTGTGSGGDYWVMLDAGAHQMLDFTDVGLASTYRIDFPIVERKAIELLDHLTESGCGAIVVEIADGLFQRETSRLLQSAAFRERIDGYVVAAPDAMGAVGSLAHLRQLDLPVLAIAGRITRSPLATREAAELCDAPVLTLDDLSDADTVAGLFGPRPTADGVPLLEAPSEPFGARVDAPEADRVIDLTEQPRDVVDLVEPHVAVQPQGNGSSPR
jgi:hypothetical protein